MNDRELLFSAMAEDEDMRAGNDRTLFGKELREDRELTQYLTDMNSFGIASIPPNTQQRQEEMF